MGNDIGSNWSKRSHSAEGLASSDGCCVSSGKSRFVTFRQDTPSSRFRSAVSPAFLPVRNALFLVLACPEATGTGEADCRPTNRHDETHSSRRAAATTFAGDMWSCYQPQYTQAGTPR
jgi:hypothetical protein